MEAAGRRPFLWLICRLYANEIPLRHLLKKLDGKASEPFSFTGNIEMKLQKCKNLTIDKSIQCFDVKSIEIYCQNMNADQKHLLQIYSAISEGDADHCAFLNAPGAFSHYRWLTTVKRILRL